MFVKIIGEESPIETIELEKPTNTSTIKQTVDRVLIDTTIKEVAVIGDIHGTTKFIDGYNHILKHNNHVNKIIVMGDHFDPYDDIPFDTMVGRYNEFIECMKSDDRIISLLGNHDLSKYIIYNDETSRSERFHTHVKKLSNLIESNLDKSRLIYECNGYLFSHAGVSEYWVNTVAEPEGFNFEKLKKVGWTEYELCSIAKYSIQDFSRWGNSPYQGPTWIRPTMLAKHPYGNYNQIVGHTMICSEKIREFCFGDSDFNVEKSENGFYKVKMINDKDLWFVDNEGKSEYLVLSL